MKRNSLAELLRPALLKVSENLLTSASTNLVEAAATKIPAVAASALGAGGLQVAIQFLRFAFAGSDAISEVRETVTKLVRQPLVTGIEQLRLLLTMSPVGPAECEYRTDRARDALVQLDTALAVAEPEDRHGIHLLMGMTGSLIPGGEEEAIFHFEEFAFAVETEADVLEFRAQIYDADSQGLSRQALRLAPGRELFEAKPKSWGSTSDLQKKARLERRATEEAAIAARYRGEAFELHSSTAVVRMLIADLQNRRSSRL